MTQIQYGNKLFLCETKRETLDLDPLRVQHITQVYSGSPAAKLGVKPGDYLGIVNNLAGVEVDIANLEAEQDENNYLIHRPSESITLLIKTPNLPLGIEIEHTSETIILTAKKQELEFEQLYQLWERKDWNALLTASISEQGLNDLLFGFIAKFRKKKAQTPVVLMHGVALYELGKTQEAIELIEYYRQNIMDYWTTEWHALTFYYLGLVELKHSSRDDALELLYTSAHYCRCSQLLGRLHALGIEVSSPTPWNEKVFPINFELKTFDKSLTIKLSQTLEQLPDNSLLYICVMPSYRANGPYDQHLRTFEKILKNFPNLTSSLYVITNVSEPNKGMKRWLGTEKRLVKEGVEIVVLYDENDLVSDHLEQTTSPNIYIVNKDGVILNSGIDFEFSAIWTVFEKEFGNIFNKTRI